MIGGQDEYELPNPNLNTTQIYDPTTDTWTSFTQADWLVDKYVNDIFADSQWNIWFSTIAWASMYNPALDEWTTYTIANWIADNDVQVIYEDQNHNIWFGTKDWVTIYKIY